MTGMDSTENLGMRAPATGDAEEGVGSIGQPMKDCAPCVQNIQLQTTTVVTGFVDQSKRGVKMAAPLDAAILAPLGLLSSSSVSSRPHAPPAASAPLYALISVLRI